MSTWPRPLRDALTVALAGVEPSTVGGDLRLPVSESEVTDLLGGEPLRTYHATRLLPHEVESVRREGLRALSPDHVERRITEAVAAGAITGSEAARMRAETVYATGFQGIRTGQVCAVVGLTAFSEDWRGVWPLLTSWGGEAIYFHASPEGAARLRSALGSPSIVVLDLQLDIADWDMFPGLETVLGAHLAGLSGLGADMFYRADVSASAVVDIWQPGCSDYDRFPDLPRA
ncbi:MAG: hypothetical protein JWP59_4790 [Massilia sp.]|nr:hypothetical protein [Massilia sp.]